jgi:hypothetical protein
VDDRSTTEVFSPIPLSITAHMLAIIHAKMGGHPLRCAPTQRIPATPSAKCYGETPHTDVIIHLVSENESTVYDERVVQVHTGWADVLMRPMSEWDCGTTNLILASAGCCYVFSEEEGPPGIPYSATGTHSTQVLARRSDPSRFVILRTEDRSAFPVNDTIVIPVHPWIQRGMLHVTSDISSTLARGRCIDNDAEAQTHMFESLGAFICEMKGNVRMVRIDIAFEVMADAMHSLCMVLRNTLLICFQAPGISFAVGMHNKDTYAVLSRACAHLKHVNLGSPRMTVNVLPPHNRPPKGEGSSPLAIAEHDIVGRVQRVRDACILTRHLSEQERRQEPARTFLQAHAAFMDNVGSATYAHLWESPRPQ